MRPDQMKHPSMCPQCGWVYDNRGGLVPPHFEIVAGANTAFRCMGSEQNPRNPRADRRPLWNEEPNPHIDADGNPMF